MITKEQRSQIVEAGRQAITRQQRLEALNRYFAYEERRAKEGIDWDEVRDEHIRQEFASLGFE